MNSKLVEPDLGDELVLLAEVPQAPDHVVEAARLAVRRAAVVEEMKERARRTRRRRARWVAVGTVAAATLAIGLVRIDIGGHEVTGSPAAAAVLERAARATLAEQDLVAGPGQYLKITLVQQSWNSISSDETPYAIGRDGKPAVSQERWTRTVWLPHDASRPMVIKARDEVLRNTTTDPRYRQRPLPPESVSRASWSNPKSDNYLKTYDPAWYATLPRDPDALVARLDKEFHGEGSGAAYDFSENYSEVLRSGVAPAAVRAALFRALAKMPGMQVTEDVTTLDGRRGVALSAKGTSFQMVFDTETGRYIGERATNPSFPEVPGLDAAKTTWLTSVTTTVVDHAPNAPAREAVPEG